MSRTANALVIVMGLALGLSVSANVDLYDKNRKQSGRIEVLEIEIASQAEFIDKQDEQVQNLTRLYTNFHKDAEAAKARVDEAKRDQDALRRENSRLRAEADRLRRVAVAARASRSRERQPVARPSAPVRVAARSGGVPATLRRIAGCESGSGPTSAPNYKAENPVSTASGAYQFVNGTWRGTTGLAPPASAHPPAVQDAAAIKLWAGGRGAHHWAASRHCWG